MKKYSTTLVTAEGILSKSYWFLLINNNFIRFRTKLAYINDSNTLEVIGIIKIGR